MAGSQEEIIAIYRAQVDGYVKEIDAIVKKVRELTGVEDQHVKNQKIGERSLIDSAAQRKKLLNDEIANLKKLQEQSKRAFTVPEIQSFNSQILQSKNNIALLGGETKKLTPTIDGIQNQFKQLGAALIGAFGVQQIIAFGKESFKSFENAQKSAKLLETAIINVAGGDNSAVARFLDQATQLQETTIFSDEQIQQAQTLAFQFGLTQKQVEDLIPVIADFASATGQDLQTALESVLRGTEGQARGLKVYGIEVQHTGDRTRDLAQITDQLTQKFAGQAEIVGNTASGAMAKLGNQIDELKEIIGEGIASLLLGDTAPASDIFKNEQIALQEIILKVNDVNISQKDRIALIDELKVKYPEYLKNINSETISNNELNVALGKVNESLINKIVLSDKQSEIDKQEQNTNKERVRQAQALTDAATGLLEVSQKTGIPLDLNLSPREKILDLIKKATAANKEDLLTFEAKNGQILNLQTVLLSLQRTEERVNKESAIGLDLEKQKVELAKILNVEIAKPKQKVFEDITFNKEKFEQDLKDIQTQIGNLQFDIKGNVLNPRLQEKLLEDQKRVQGIIDNITGKAQAERDKKAEDAAKQLRDKLLAQEKQTQDAINKLRIELAPTEEEKVIIKAEIDRESLKKVEDDFRTLAEIQKDIDSDKITFLRLNALKLLSDLQAIDQKRLEDIRKNADETIKVQNEGRLKILQDQLKNAQEEIKFAEELENELNRAKIAMVREGSDEELAIRKDILERNAAQEIIANLGNAKKIQEIELRLQNDIGELDAEFSQKRIENFKQTFEAITSIASEFVNIFVEFERAKSDAVIQGLEEQQEATNAALDKESEDLQDARDRRLISEKEFEDRSKKIKEERIASEKKIQEAIRVEKRKAAERDKAIAIFEATINLAQAIVTALTAGPVVGIIIAALTAALGAVQLAAIIATPIPTFAKGTKDKKESGMAIVGERGQELVHLPSAAQVLPAPQTKKNREVINAMFDNNFDEYVRKKYVQPEINKEKLSTQKKYEILKQVYEKQAVENYNKSVLEKYDITRTNALNNIVNNYVNNIISNEQTNTKAYNELINKRNELTELIKSTKDTVTNEKLTSEVEVINNKINSVKNSVEDVTKKRDELSKILNEAKISHSDSFDQKEKLISEIKNIEISEVSKKELTNKVNEVLSSTATFKELRETINKISREYEQTDVHNSLNNIHNKIANLSSKKETAIKENYLTYDSKFERSINTNYVSAALEENRAKAESKKQETFAQNIANSFMLQNQTIFDNEKIQSAVENGFRAATKRGVFMRNFEQLAEAIADKNKPDFRKM